MKKLLIPFLLLISLYNIGCNDDRFIMRNFEYNISKTANIGSIMITLMGGIKVHTSMNFNIAKAIREELSYGGIDHNIIQIDYREYNVNKQGVIIIKGFSQSFKYDLSVSKTIIFKKIKIEIQNATNNNITFKVIIFQPDSFYDNAEQIYSPSL
jgi:hypothetical protein